AADAVRCALDRHGAGPRALLLLAYEEQGLHVRRLAPRRTDRGRHARHAHRGRLRHRQHDPLAGPPTRPPALAEDGGGGAEGPLRGGRAATRQLRASPGASLTPEATLGRLEVLGRVHVEEREALGVDGAPDGFADAL